MTVQDPGALATEFVSSALGHLATQTPIEFLGYANERMDDEVETMDDAYELVSLMTIFAASVIKSWAEDTDRSPEDVMQTIALSRVRFADGLES